MRYKLVFYFLFLFFIDVPVLLSVCQSGSVLANGSDGSNLSVMVEGVSVLY